MKSYALLASLVIAGTLFLSLAGCNKSENSTGKASTPTATSSPGQSASAAKISSSFRGLFIGTWKTAPGSPGESEIHSITINDNGTFVISNGNGGAWRGPHFILGGGRGNEAYASLESDGRLSISDGGKTLYFEKE